MFGGDLHGCSTREMNFCGLTADCITLDFRGYAEVRVWARAVRFGYNETRARYCMAAHHPVRNLLRELAASSEFQGVVRQLASSGSPNGTPVEVNASGLTAVAKTLFAALLNDAIRQPLLYIVRS